MLSVALQQVRDLYRHVSFVVGCKNFSGAAKLINLMKSLAPRVLIVEEAGQVLEAHILGSLVTSVEHLIMIGDPLQLRPNVSNFSEPKCRVLVNMFLTLH